MQRLVLGGLAATLLLAIPSPIRASLGPPAENAPAGVFPVPQLLLPRPEAIVIPGHVRLVVTRSSDAAAVTVVKAAFRASGATDFRPTPATLTVFVGRNARAEAALEAATAAGLPAGGYVLAAGQGADGRSVIVLDGADRTGQYYAAQSLRQLVNGQRRLQGVVIRDWPSFQWRGVVEGFYGPPWTQSERLSTLDFLGAHKLNLYMYGPKDDPQLRENWAAPFSASSLAAIRVLVTRAGRDHVTFNIVISPGLSICYSSPTDQQSVIQKLAAAWDVGVRSFTVALDDISLDRTRCASDAAFGSGDAGIAAAQASLVNAVDTQFIATHRGARRLIAVPTEYNGTEATSYTKAFSTAVAPDVIVQWTGRYGISVAISSADAAAASEIYAHPVLIWDNYFVNDYARGFLALGPLDRHDSALPDWTLGIAADPMVEPESSRIGLFTVADYTWNSTSYDPLMSWEASLREFANGDRVATDALRTFADANWGSLLNPVSAPSLSEAIDSFWTAWAAGDASAARALDTRLRALATAPAVLRARLLNQAFLAEASPWLDATQAWALAARSALTLLVARHNGVGADGAATALPGQIAAAQAFGTRTPPVFVAAGVLDKFIVDVQAQVG